MKKPHTTERPEAIKESTHSQPSAKSDENDSGTKVEEVEMQDMQGRTKSKPARRD